MMQAVRLYVHVEHPTEQAKLEGDYAMLCMAAKNYDVQFEGRCKHAPGDTYLATTDERCYAPHKGD
jgi:hypothetical protein